MTRRVGGPVAALLLLLIMAGCAVNSDPLRSSGEVSAAPDLVIGAPETAEGAVLAQLYAGALQSKGITAGIESVGERADYLGKLRAGSLALVPDHTGALLTELDPGQAASTATEVDEQLPAAAGADLMVIKPAPATTQVAYVITKAAADQHKITTLDQLTAITKGTVLGGPAGLPQQKYGPAALTAIYGVDFASFKAYPDSTTLARDLGDGTISVGAFNAADPVLAGDSFVRLADPESMVLPEHITAVAGARLKDNPAAVAAVEAVHAALTTEELTVLQSQVRGGTTVEQAAGDWLKAKGLA